MGSVGQVNIGADDALLPRLQSAKRVNKAAALRTAQFALRRGEYNIADTAPRQLIQDEQPISNRVKTNALKPFTIDEKNRFAHPYYWSPLVLIGNIK